MVLWYRKMSRGVLFYLPGGSDDSPQSPRRVSGVSRLSTHRRRQDSGTTRHTWDGVSDVSVPDEVPRSSVIFWFLLVLPGPLLILTLLISQTVASGLDLGSPRYSSFRFLVRRQPLLPTGSTWVLTVSRCTPDFFRDELRPESGRENYYLSYVNITFIV